MAKRGIVQPFLPQPPSLTVRGCSVGAPPSTACVPCSLCCIQDDLILHLGLLRWQQLGCTVHLAEPRQHCLITDDAMGKWACMVQNLRRTFRTLHLQYFILHFHQVLCRYGMPKATCLLHRGSGTSCRALDAFQRLLTGSALSCPLMPLCHNAFGVCTVVLALVPEVACLATFAQHLCHCDQCVLPCPAYMWSR